MCDALAIGDDWNGVPECLTTYKLFVLDVREMHTIHVTSFLLQGDFRVLALSWTG